MRIISKLLILFFQIISLQLMTYQQEQIAVITVCIHPAVKKYLLLFCIILKTEAQVILILMVLMGHLHKFMRGETLII